MSSVVINGDTSGSVTLAAPAVAGSTTLTLPTTTSTLAFNGPAFSAYSGSTTSLSGGAFTKVTLDTEDFDTNNNFASSRFTPTVAGYYQINGGVSVATGNQLVASIYKNGGEFKRGSNIRASSDGSVVSSLVYFNGTTDYAELYCFSGTTINTNTGSNLTYFNGSMVRSA